MAIPSNPYQSTRFAALAHRGGSLYAPNVGRENTLLAFRNAVDLGYRFIETDVQATSDGQLVIFHDDTLDRLTGVSGQVAQFSWAELSQLRVGGEPIATLDEALETFPEVCWNIDLKQPGAVEPLVSALRRHQAEQRVLVDSFSQARLSRFRTLTDGRVATAATQAGIAWGVFAPWLPRHYGTPGVAYQIPLSYQIGPLMVTTFSKQLVDNAHRAGRLVHVWTIDDVPTMERVIDQGADGIITDRPDTLKEVLQARGLWEG